MDGSVVPVVDVVGRGGPGRNIQVVAPAALRLRFFGASIVPVHAGVPQRQANRRFNAGVWRSS
jgi:hypothetical protein